MSWLYWALLSAFFAAVTATTAKLGVKDIDANLATAIRTSVVAALCWGIVGATSRSSTWGSIPRRAWMFLVASGLATGLSWLFYFHAIQNGPLNRVAPVDKLSVVLTIGFATLLLGETLTWKLLAGATLITGGAILIALD